MDSAIVKNPSRGRLFKLFTEMGPYFRVKLSSEETYLYDCLEVCIDAEEEPELRTFYGWWLVVTKENNQFVFERFNGIFDIKSEWNESPILAEHQEQLDKSFNLFVIRLQTLLKLETGLSLSAKDQFKDQIKKPCEKIRTSPILELSEA
jgi:sigma factor-binding protein Crl